MATNARYIDPNYHKKYYQSHKEEIKKQQQKYRESNKETCKAKTKKYQETHKAEYKANAKRYYESHKDEIRNKYRATHPKKPAKTPEEITQAKKQKDKTYRENHPDRIKQAQKQYRETHRDNRIYNDSKRRGLGFKPLNKHFKASAAHHLHLENSKDFLVYIPFWVHDLNRHKAKNLESMTTINAIALDYWVNESMYIQLLNL